MISIIDAYLTTGGHKPQGRVTAISGSAMTPTIRNPVGVYQYAHGNNASFRIVDSAVHTHHPQQSLPASGYSSVHTQHDQEKQRWSAYAYKGPPPLSQAGLVHLNIEVCEPVGDANGNLIRVPVCPFSFYTAHHQCKL